MSALHEYNHAGHVMITNYSLNDISTMEAKQHIDLSMLHAITRNKVIRHLKKGVNVANHGKARAIINILMKEHGVKALPCISETSGYIPDCPQELKEFIEALDAVQSQSSCWTSRWGVVDKGIVWERFYPGNKVYDEAVKHGVVNPDNPALVNMIEDVELGKTITIETRS